MDPSTGTFISMDSYAGTLYDPVSLHKYLYANANPVMNTDPSGYFSLSECIVTVGQKISMVNQKIHEIKTLQKMMNTANALCTAYDMLTMMKEVWLGERSIVDVALVLLRGIAIGYLINCACGTQLGVVLKPVLGALGVKSNVDELVEAINNRDVVEIIVRSVQLVCAIFGMTAQCFTGDTLISTENGLVPIEEIKVGNLVWTENIETGEQELKEVTTVYVNKTDKILHLTIEKEGDIETIDTTEGHPFYVEGKGWVRAGTLQEGDILTSETGTAVVVSKQTESLSVPKIIYNLEVADNHTYYVSEEKVLVHNTCENNVDSDNDSKPSSKKLRDNMIEAGQEEPSYKNAAHHIVAGSSTKAQEARAILRKYGIDINASENGVFLPTEHGVSEAAYHPSLHTDAYYKKVNSLISKASNRSEAIKILDAIRNCLLNGTF